MSRIGKKAIVIPSDLQTEISLPLIRFKKGDLVKEINLPEGLSASLANDQLKIKRLNDLKITKSLHGTYRSLINNLVNSFKEQFTKKLELHGIGYRASVEGSELKLSLGFTHPVKVAIPQNISVQVEKNVLIVKGDDLQKLGQFCAELRALRKPEPYKGKGIRYEKEYIAIKQGKATRTSA